jgi:hypothetical protein
MSDNEPEMTMNFVYGYREEQYKLRAPRRSTEANNLISIVLLCCIK